MWNMVAVHLVSSSIKPHARTRPCTRRGETSKGDKGGKKDKSKQKKQGDNKRNQKEKDNRDRQPKKISK